MGKARLGLSYIDRQIENRSFYSSVLFFFFLMNIGNDGV
jgi:hypothetical protein